MFEDPKQQALSEMLEMLGYWKPVATAILHHADNGHFSPIMPLGQVALAMMFIAHPGELLDQILLMTGEKGEANDED